MDRMHNDFIEEIVECADDQHYVLVKKKIKKNSYVCMHIKLGYRPLWWCGQGLWSGAGTHVTPHHQNEDNRAIPCQHLGCAPPIEVKYSE